MLLWMLYTISVAGVVAVICICLEHMLMAVRRPARFVWVAGVCIAAGASALAMKSGNVMQESESMMLSVSGVDARTGDAAPSSVAGKAGMIGLSALDKPLTLAWLLGSILSAVVLAGIAVRTRHVLRRADRKMIDGTVVLMTQDLGPALAGVLRYEIVVPEWLSALPREQQALVIEHERQHARAFDPVLIWMSAAAIVAFPWNPAFWFMLRRLRTAIELDCDSRVLNRYPDAAGYAALLVDVTERASSFPVLAAALSESPTQLQRRIRTIVSGSRPLRPFAAFGSAAIVAVLLTAAAKVPEPAFPSTAERGSSADTISSGGDLSPIEAAEDAARRLEPGAFDRVRSPGSSVIALLFDSTGRIVHHSRLSVPDTNENLLRLMPRLFPNVRQVENAPFRIMSRIEGVKGSRHVDVFAVFLKKPPAERLAPVYYEYQVEKPVTQLPGVGNPVYPAALRESRIQGEVQAQFVVNEQGVVRTRTFKAITATNDLFAAAVRDALGNMRFMPAEHEGMKVQQIVQQAFLFRLD